MLALFGYKSRRERNMSHICAVGVACVSGRQNVVVGTGLAGQGPPSRRVLGGWGWGLGCVNSQMIERYSHMIILALACREIITATGCIMSSVLPPQTSRTNRASWEAGKSWATSRSFKPIACAEYLHPQGCSKRMYDHATLAPSLAVEKTSWEAAH